VKATKADTASLLFPASYRRQVLSLPLLKLEQKLHVREIARLTRTAAGTLSKELGLTMPPEIMVQATRVIR
jgi:hypothetical protein